MAWALGFNDRVMWPKDDFEWPRDPPAGPTVNEFIEVFQEYYGFEECASHLYEEGFIKLALFVENSEPQHVAVQRRHDGMWESKLGSRIDILHSGLDVIADFPMNQPDGPCTGFGAARYFFRKRHSIPTLHDFARNLERFSQPSSIMPR